MRLAMLGLLAALVFSSIFVLVKAPHAYAVQDRSAVASTTSHTHPIGTDELGRDRGARLALALLLGLTGASCAAAIASACAVALGSLAAFSPSWLSRAILYGGDLFLTLPWLFLLMLVRSVLPLTLAPWQSGTLTFLLLALLGTPAFLRLNYERVSSLTRTDWMLQARATGITRPQFLRQMLPHLRPLLWTQFLLYVPACLIAEANLGALGLGISEPLPSLGTFVASLQSAALADSSRLVFLPVAVLVLVLVVLELMVFGAAE